MQKSHENESFFQLKTQYPMQLGLGLQILWLTLFKYFSCTELIRLGIKATKQRYTFFCRSTC
jgi:hypothetical protein